MKNLKVKSILFSLFAVLMVSVFMISCDQETIVDSAEDLTSLAERISEDSDAIAFIVASERVRIVVDEKIQDNQIAYDRYVVAEDFDAIRELLNYDTEILPLENELSEKREIVLEKYPNIEDIEGITIGSQLEEVTSRGWCRNYWSYHWCTTACAVLMDKDCADHCWWYWCTSEGF